MGILVGNSHKAGAAAHGISVDEISGHMGSPGISGHGISGSQDTGSQDLRHGISGSQARDLRISGTGSQVLS